MDATLPYQEASRELLKQRIITATSQLVADSDWSTLTMASIATKAGVSRQTIYACFGNRDGLLEALAKDALQRVREPFELGIAGHVGNVEKAIESAIANFIGYCAENPLMKTLHQPSPEHNSLQPVVATTLGEEIFVVLETSWLELSESYARTTSSVLATICSGIVAQMPQVALVSPADISTAIAPFIHQDRPQPDPKTP